MKRLLPGLILLVALTGCGQVTAQQGSLAAGNPSSEPVSASATASAQPDLKPSTVPTRLRLGTIDAPVVPLELTGSSLIPPSDPMVLGWWGKRAGAVRGTTLLTGHTVHAGGGTFDDLEHTSLGERARINGHAYTVTAVEVISKKELRQRAADLFSQTGPHQLVLVTCEDYDATTGDYSSNVVVTLHPDG